VIQTRNRIASPNAEPGGPYLAVFSGDLSRARFVSVIPGVGAAQLSNYHPWAVVTGVQNGKPRALFLAGATKEADVYGRVSPTPVKNALQSTFGGGESDGYLVLVDLSRGTQPLKSESGPAQPARLTNLRGAHGKGGKHDVAVPVRDREFFFSATYPRYVTVDAEFRDAKGAQWPSFLYGKPIEGSATWKDGELSAKVAVSCSSWCQPRGNQSRRVIHQLIADSDKPPVLTFCLETLESPNHEEVKEIDNRGKEQIKTVDYAAGKATLDIGGKTLSLAPRVTWTLHALGRDSARVGIRMTAWFTFKGRDIGLTGTLANEEIDGRVSWTGEEGSAPPPPQAKNSEKKKKKK